MPFVLDDGYSLADPEQQKAVSAELRKNGVDVNRLLHSLRKLPTSGILIRERRSQRWLTVWPDARRVYNDLVAVYKRYDHRRQKASQKQQHQKRRDEVKDAFVEDFWEDIEDAFDEILGLASRPDRELDCREPRRYADERGASRIRRGATLPAVQQRYMPEVREVVWRRIYRALERHKEGKLEGEADRLTAAFIVAFYPLWGASTTADTVRKSRSTMRRR